MLYIISLLLTLILCVLINLAAAIKKNQIQQRQLLTFDLSKIDQRLLSINQVLEYWNPEEVERHLFAIADTSKDIASSIKENEKRIVEVKEKLDERLSEVSYRLQSIDEKG
jgi:hypothetical protein